MMQASASRLIPNTFGINAYAKTVIKISSIEHIKSLIGYSGEPRLILGGGSNILLTQDFEGTVLLNLIKGISIKARHDGTALVTCGAGENWAAFVDTMVEQGWFGLENLSLIPGNTGASPIQNIGAYGVEICQRFVSTSAVNIDTGEERSFNALQCHFGYRNSIFKEPSMASWMITAVTFNLSKQHEPCLAYGELKRVAGEVAQTNNRKRISNQDLATAVKAIRRSKLPDPTMLGNAGSFFKNPLVTLEKAEQLQSLSSGLSTSLPIYPQSEPYSGTVKISAAWLIDQCGWKGARKGDAGVHEQHALVLVNYGKATGAQVWELASQIIASVNAKFGLTLEPEPVVL